MRRRKRVHARVPAGPLRPAPPPARERPVEVVVRPSRSSTPVAPAYPLRPLIAEYTAIFDITWSPVTRRKHADDYARLIDWLEEHELPVTTASLDFLTLVEYVRSLRTRPKVTGFGKTGPDGRPLRRVRQPEQPLSANSVNAYVRPIRSLCIWLIEEGLLTANPFNRSRRRSALNPLLPSEETPAKSATLADLRALEAGCAGDDPLALRDQAIVSLLETTAARNSSVRLLRIGDVDLERRMIRFRHAKGGKTLLVTLHESSAAAVARYLACGRAGLPGGDDGGDADGYLFLSSHGVEAGQPLSMNALSGMLTRRYRAGGGTLRRFGSHRIRHATATMLVNNGMGIDEVSRYLGHSSTLPTRRYAQHTPDTLGTRAADALARSGLV